MPDEPVAAAPVAVATEATHSAPAIEGGASRGAGSGVVAFAAPVARQGPPPALPPELDPRRPATSPSDGSPPHYVPVRPVATPPKRGGGGPAVFIVGLTILAVVCLFVGVGVWQYLSGLGSTGSSGSGGEPLAVDTSVTMVATRGTPVIDGQTTDWNDVGTFDCSAPVAGSSNPAFRGLWAMKWDDDNLYLLAGVFDPVLTQTHDVDVDQLWRGDSVSFELGPDARNRDPGKGARQSDDHFLFGPTLGGTVINAVNHGPGFGSGTSDPSIVARMAFAEGGYIIEIALPWSSTGLGSVQENTVVSINLNMSDADQNSGDLATMVSTNPIRSPENQQHPGLWQRLQLRSA